MSSIPLVKTGSQGLDLFMTRLKSEVDPVLANPLVSGLHLRNISLSVGNNVVNHLLSRMMQGWIISDISGPAVIWRSAPLSTQTLTLTCSAVAAVTVNIWAF